MDKTNTEALSRSERDERCLFLGNVPYETTNEFLFTLLSAYGEVENVNLLAFKSGKPKGCAFIEFPSREEAQKVAHEVENNGLYIMGRKIRANIVRPLEKKNCVNDPTSPSLQSFAQPVPPVGPPPVRTKLSSPYFNSHISLPDLTGITSLSHPSPYARRDPLSYPLSLPNRVIHPPPTPPPLKLVDFTRHDSLQFDHRPPCVTRSKVPVVSVQRSDLTKLLDKRTRIVIEETPVKSASYSDSFEVGQRLLFGDEVVEVEHCGRLLCRVRFDDGQTKSVAKPKLIFLPEKGYKLLLTKITLPKHELVRYLGKTGGPVKDIHYFTEFTEAYAEVEFFTNKSAQAVLQTDHGLRINYCTRLRC